MAAWHQHTLDWYLCLQDVLCLQSLELHRAYIHDAGLISHASMSQQICWCEQLSPLVLGCVIFLLSVVCLVLALFLPDLWFWQSLCHRMPMLGQGA